MKMVVSLGHNKRNVAVVKVLDKNVNDYPRVVYKFDCPNCGRRVRKLVPNVEGNFLVENYFICSCRYCHRRAAIPIKEKRSSSEERFNLVSIW
jgi:hypothetical protein